jgi:hypothetical protein
VTIWDKARLAPALLLPGPAAAAAPPAASPSPAAAGSSFLGWCEPAGGGAANNMQQISMLQLRTRPAGIWFKPGFTSKGETLRRAHNCPGTTQDCCCCCCCCCCPHLRVFRTLAGPRVSKSHSTTWPSSVPAASKRGGEAGEGGRGQEEGGGMRWRRWPKEVPTAAAVDCVRST